MDLEHLATILSADPDYKVLRRIKPRFELSPAPNRPLAKDVVIDTGTRGLDPDTSKIIEIGLVAFEYDPVSGQPIRVIGSYGGLEDPGHHLSEETTELTGITDGMVAGQQIDSDRVNAFVVANTSIVRNCGPERRYLRPSELAPSVVAMVMCGNRACRFLH